MNNTTIIFIHGGFDLAPLNHHSNNFSCYHLVCVHPDSFNNNLSLLSFVLYKFIYNAFEDKIKYFFFLDPKKKKKINTKPIQAVDEFKSLIKINMVGGCIEN